MFLPEIDGWTVIERLRVNKQMQHVPVLVVSSAMLAGIEGRVRAVGGDAVLAKPVAMYDLPRQVHDLPASTRA